MQEEEEDLEGSLREEEADLVSETQKIETRALEKKIVAVALEEAPDLEEEALEEKEDSEEILAEVEEITNFQEAMEIAKVQAEDLEAEEITDLQEETCENQETDFIIAEDIKYFYFLIYAHKSQYEVLLNHIFQHISF